MRTSIGISALVLAALTAAPGDMASQQMAMPDSPPHIETTGYGERRVAPDRATVMINVTTKAASAAAAAAENARLQARVMDTLRAIGVGNAATTASYNVGPNYEDVPVPRTGPRPAGYAARASIRVRVADLKEVGRVIDASLARGATGVDGVFFETSTEAEARRAAIAEAAAAARADAEALARSLGGSLGTIISANTSFSGMDRRRDMVMSRGAVNGWAGGASNQIAPSEIVIAAGAIVRWAFVPAR
jgi:uncharacterized protein YggE